MGVAWVRKFLWYGWLVALVAISVWIYIRSFLKIWRTVKVRQANRNHSLISIYLSHIRSDSNRSHAMLQECCVTSARAATKETSFMWGRNWNSYFAWFAGLWSFPRSSERLREVVIFAHTAQSAHFSVLFLFLLVVIDTVSIDRCSVTRILSRCLYAALRWCFSKNLLSILLFSSDSSLAATTALKKFLRPSGKHSSCFGKSSWIGTNSFRNSANTNCFQPRNVVGNVNGYQDWSTIWKLSRVCPFCVQQVVY